MLPVPFPVALSAHLLCIATRRTMTTYSLFRPVLTAAHRRRRCSAGRRHSGGDRWAGARAVTAERTALNLLQILSRIATATREYVERIRGTGCILLDTRKTIPGMRRLSKYATRCGGAQNHRMGLFDAILIKDNHIAVCDSISQAVSKAKLAVRTSGPSTRQLTIEIECDTLAQVREAVEAGVDTVLLDNMSHEELRQAVGLVGGRAKTEASGGVTLETVRAIAESGVDFVFGGTHYRIGPGG
jgi:nicotinate-nucleotide pyrophosphorylase (carboxylating)